MSNSGLPSSWCMVPLGQFVENQKGKKPKNQSKSPDERFNLPYIDIEAFEENIIKSWTDGENCRLCYEADFLMVWDGSRSGLVGKGINGALGSTLVRINFPHINNDYAYYFLQSKYLEINTRAKGSGTPHVDPDLLWNYEFPIPPINEQARILTKIEQLFSELDKGVEALKTAQTQLKVYRQALLEWAMVDLPKNLEIETKPYFLSELITPIRQGWSPKCDPRQSYDPKGWAIIKTTVVQRMQYLGNEFKPLPPTLVPKPEIEVSVGDFLMTRKGPRKRTGVSCLVRETAPRLMVCDTVYKFRAFEDKILPDLLEVLLNTPSTMLKIEGMKSGINDSGVSLTHKKLYSLKFEVPTDLKDQKKVLEALSEKKSVIDHIEANIKTQLKKSAAMRQSILKKAFSGQLVPQDPTDEPAVKLLERIKAEKAAIAAKTKTARKPRRKKAS